MLSLWVDSIIINSNIVFVQRRQTFTDTQLLENWTLPLHARAHVTHVIESLGPVLSTALHKHMQIELLGMVEQVVHTNLDAPYLLHFATFDEKQVWRSLLNLSALCAFQLVSRYLRSIFSVLWEFCDQFLFMFMLLVAFYRNV